MVALPRRRAVRDALTDTAADAAIDQACRILRLPAIRARRGEVAAAASREQASYKRFLIELLSLECDDLEACRKARRVRDTALPRPERIEDFDFAANPNRSRRAHPHPRPERLGGRRAARVQRGQGVGAGGDEVVRRAGFHVRNPQREPVRGEQGLDVAAVGTGFGPSSAR